VAALTLVVFDRGETDVRRGSLIDCPIEFLSPAQLRYYQSCKAGWSRCPLDHWVYSALDPMGRKWVVPAVIIPTEKAPRRKFPGLASRFERVQIEKFVAPHLQISEEIKFQRDQEFKNLTHDLRAISTEIYHTALTARDRLADQGASQLVADLDSVLAAQQMMSVRLDIVDYESGLAAGRPKENVAIFKKVEKVFKCFYNKMRSCNVTGYLEGRSFGLSFGPPIFEIVPFVIIENAIKYSPKGGEYKIRFEENDDQILVRFESFGPKIKDSEKDKIFSQAYRGEAAAVERNGSGIGLYAAKTLVENHFGGKIFVNQLEDKLYYNDSVYFSTRFTVILPKVAERQIDSVGRRHFQNRSFRRLLNFN